MAVKWADTKDFLIRLKVYIDRARMYLSYVQLCLIVVVFVKAINLSIPKWFYIPICVFGFFAAVGIGWLDKKLGLFEAENKRISEQNPILTEILEAVKKK